MSPIFKRITAFALTTVMALALFAGCGSAKETDQDQSSAAASTAAPEVTATAQPAQKTDITFWFYPRYNVPGKENGVYEKELAQDFMSKNPDVNITTESIPWNGGPEKINVAISSNMMPDSVFDFPGRIIGYAAKGVLVDLSDMLTENDKTDIDPGILSHGMYDGKLYMYPTAVTVVGMAVNKKLLKDAGALDLLPLNKPDRTWSIAEFEKALEAVKNNLKGVQPIVIYSGNEQGDASIRMQIQNFGADFVDKDHTKVVINSEAGVKGLQWFVDSYKKGLFAPGAESAVSTDALDMFQQGKAAFCIIYGAANRNILLKAIADGTAPKDFELAYLPQPTFDGSKAKVEAQVVGYPVFDNKDEAKAAASKKFIDYLSNNKDIVKNIGAFPVRKSFGDLYDDPELKFLSTLTSQLGDTGYTINNYAKVRALWFPEMQAVLTGAKTPKEALDEFAQQATEVMNEK